MIAIFLEAMAEGLETIVYGDGSQTRDFVHVDDIVSAALASFGSGGVFNVGSGVETSIAELHARCRAVTGTEQPPRIEPAREGDVLRSALDISRIEQDLGWRPQVSLDDGLRRTWDWIRAS